MNTETVEQPEVVVGRPGDPLPTGPRTAAWGSGAPDHGTTPHPGAGSCPACERIVYRPGGRDRLEVTSPEAAAGVLVPRLANGDRERCLAALLDTKHRLLEVVVVSVGSIDHTFMAPREVYRDALLANAAALVLAHGHPSGDPTPSRDDELLTRRLGRAGDLIGVELLDHLVVGGSDWVSLARRGALS